MDRGKGSGDCGFVQLWSGAARGSGEFDDGRDGAVGLVLDDLLDERFGRGGGGGRVGRNLGWEQGDDELERIKHLPGALFVEVVGRDAAEQVGGDSEGGGAVLDDGKLEGLLGVEVAELSGRGLGAAGGVVVVTEVLVAQGGGAALVAGGVDVAAAVSGVRDGDAIGWLWHGVPLPGGKYLKSWLQVG